MNRCREARHIQDYLEGELALERSRGFEAHLEGCVECRAEVASYRTLFASLDGSLDRVTVEDPGPALTERILDRVLPSRLRRRWGGRDCNKRHRGAQDRDQCQRADRRHSVREGGCAGLEGAGPRR